MRVIVPTGRKSDEISPGTRERWPSGAIGTNGRNPDGRDGRAMRTCGPRCSVRAAEEDSRVVGFWSARLRYPTRRVPLKRAGSSLAGPRVNDHRKPMCVTSRGSEPYSVALLTRTT